MSLNYFQAENGNGSSKSSKGYHIPNYEKSMSYEYNSSVYENRSSKSSKGYSLSYDYSKSGKGSSKSSKSSTGCMDEIDNTLPSSSPSVSLSPSASAGPTRIVCFAAKHSNPPSLPPMSSSKSSKPSPSHGSKSYKPSPPYVSKSHKPSQSPLYSTTTTTTGGTAVSTTTTTRGNTSKPSASSPSQSPIGIGEDENEPHSTTTTTGGAVVSSTTTTRGSTSKPSASSPSQSPIGIGEDETGSTTTTTTTGGTVVSRTTTTTTGSTSKPSTSPSISPTFLACTAKKVKIQSTSSNPIHMFELQVLATGTNFALQGKVDQSSVFKGNQDKFGPENAIDNDVSTFSHTELIFGSWWEIDLQQLVSVQSIHILNRYCGSDTSDPHDCLCRMSNAEIYLYNDYNDTVATRVLGDTCGEQIVLEQFASCTSTTAPPTQSPSASPTNKPTHCKEPYDGYCNMGLWDCDACKCVAGFDILRGGRNTSSNLFSIFDDYRWMFVLSWMVHRQQWNLYHTMLSYSTTDDFHFREPIVLTYIYQRKYH